MRITENYLSEISLNESDTVKSIMQNIAIILSTKRGTVPMYREFGCPEEYLDKPLYVAAPRVQAELREAIEQFEPRVEVVKVSFEVDTTTPGRLLPVAEVRIK